MTLTRTGQRLRRGAVAATLAAAAVLGGCSEAADDPATATATAQTFNDADVKFAQTMVPHHEQAVEMADAVLAKSDVDPEVTALAQKIKDTQGPEMTTMTGLLAAWNKPLIPDHGAEADEHHWDAEGMLTPEEMQELAAADGPAAQELFLEGMIEHHEGAVAMVQDEIDNGENAEAQRLAQAIKDGQTAEIVVMEKLLSRL
jgi:uncharacterized protein (DUF305 family)